MDYFDDDKLCSVNEFYNNANRLEKDLKKKGVISDEEIKEKRALLLAAQFTTRKYVECMEEEPEAYPEILPAEIMGEMEYVDAVHDYMIQQGDGNAILDSYPIISAAIMVKTTHGKIIDAGIDDCIIDRIVHSVVPAIEAVTLKAINNAPQFNIQATNIINAQKVLNTYPDIVKLMTDEATRAVFTNKSERNQWSQFTVFDGKKFDNASLLLSQSVSADPRNKVLIERKFSIYDWAVMEAVATLYSYAETNNKLVNGAVAIDVQSIDKILKRNIKSRMSEEARANILGTDIVGSLVKLMGNHVQIVDPAGTYDGDIINGELSFVANKLCVVVKSKPILFEYADGNGRNHLESIAIDNLKLNLTKVRAEYTTETIAIYRFLLGRIKEIYGSYIMDNKHMTPKPNYSNSITLDSIINAVYPEGLGKYKDITSKKRYILENTEKICKAMENKKIFFKSSGRGSNTNGDITFSFFRN